MMSSPVSEEYGVALCQKVQISLTVQEIHICHYLQWASLKAENVPANASIGRECHKTLQTTLTIINIAKLTNRHNEKDYYSLLDRGNV